MKHKYLFKIMMLNIVLVVCLLCTTANAGFLLQMNILNKTAIEQLSDEKLVDTYIDAMIELEAADVFYNNAGFKPKEYEKYKSVLRFRTDLILEMQKREIEIPKIK